MMEFLCRRRLLNSGDLIQTWWVMDERGHHLRLVDGRQPRRGLSRDCEPIIGFYLDLDSLATYCRSATYSGDFNQAFN
jgi:hypothetical protein